MVAFIFHKPAIASSVCGLLLLLVAVPTCAEEYAKVVATGAAVGSAPESRDNAIAAAKKDAVFMWLQAQVGDLDRALARPILETYEDYVLSSRTLRLDRDELTTRVEIEAYLAVWPLESDLASILMPVLAPPRVVLLVGEETVNRPGLHFDPSSIAAATLKETLVSQGFDVLDPERVREAFTQREMLAALMSGDEGIAKFGRKNRADIVIAGEARATVVAEKSGGGVLRARADLDIRVVASNDARLFKTAKSEAELSCRIPEQGASAALEDAVYKTRDRVVVGAIIAAANTDGSESFALEIERVEHWAEVEEIAGRLRGFAGVSSLEVLRSRAGSGLIQFRYSGRISKLVEEIENPLISGRRPEPSRIVGPDMTFRLITP